MQCLGATWCKIPVLDLWEKNSYFRPLWYHCATVLLPQDTTIIISVIYVHQNIDKPKLIDFFRYHLINYDKDRDFKISLVLMGDFNTSESSLPTLKDALRDIFNLNLNNDTSQPTTLRNKCLDLTFSRYLPITCHPYISYFSDHRPVFNKLTV